MTEVHLIRHARAQPRREGLPDEERRLTPAGLAQAERLRTALERLGVRYEVIWTSPVLRARQTAEVLAPLAGAVIEEPALASGWDAELLARLRARGRAVAVVAHEPELSAAAAALLEGESATFPFKKSGLYAIRWGKRPQLRYVLTPGLLKRLLGTDDQPPAEGARE
ncbi:SixA phosphatase family protein [Oceanithermus sp.]